MSSYSKLCLVQVMARRFRAGDIVDTDSLYEPSWVAPHDFEDYLEDITFSDMVAWLAKRGALPLAGPADDPGNVRIIEASCRPTRELIGLYFEGVGTYLVPYAANSLADEAGSYGWVDTLGEDQLAELLEDVTPLLEANPDIDGLHLLTIWRFCVDEFHDMESSYPELDTWSEYLGVFDDSRLNEMIKESE